MRIKPNNLKIIQKSVTLHRFFNTHFLQIKILKHLANLLLNDIFSKEKLVLKIYKNIAIQRKT